MKGNELVGALVEESLIEDVELPLEVAGTPWYLHLLSALGAWFASFFLLFFCLLFSGLDNKGSWLVMGLILAGLATLLRRSSRSELMLQPSLALWGTGSGLASFAIVALEPAYPFFLALTLLIALSFVYPHPIGRLMTLVGASCYLLAGLEDSHSSLDPILALLALGGGLIWLNRESLWRAGDYWGSLVRPFGLAAFLALFELLMCCQWNVFHTAATSATSAIFTCAVLWLAARLIHKLQVPVSAGAWALGAALLLGAVTWSVPGIMAALAVLLVGFTVQEGSLQVMAIAFLLVFASAFYYDLTLTLLGKSLTLAVLGIVLLLLRRGVRS